MVDQKLPTINKPSRSDEVIDPELQLQIAHEVRTHFESITPKRPIKPNRSEPDPNAPLAHDQAHSESIPELHRLHSLKSQSQVVLSMKGHSEVQEEFVETEYYKQLEFIDKQHHTTGTGFIKVETGGVKNNGRIYELQRLSDNGGNKTGGTFAGYKSNPATNDWNPSFDNDHYASPTPTKPSRSG